MNNNSIKFVDIEDAWAELKPSYGIVLTRRYLKDYPDDGRAMVYLGYFYTHVRRFDDALSTLKRAIRLLEKNGGLIAEAYSAMGFLYQEKGNFRVAERWYRKALDNDPDNPFHHQTVGQILSLQCNFDKAGGYFNHIISLPTERQKDQAYFEMGLIQKAMEKYREALLSFEKALEFGADKESVGEEISDLNEVFKLIS